MFLVAAISTNLNKSNDLTARISATEVCNADLEGLYALVKFGELPVKDAVTVCQQLVAKIPFAEEDLPLTATPTSNDAVAARTGDSHDQAPLGAASTGSDTAPWAATGAPPPSPTIDLDRRRSAAFLLPGMAIALASLVLLITVIGLFIWTGPPSRRCWTLPEGLRRNPADGAPR